MMTELEVQVRIAVADSMGPLSAAREALGLAQEHDGKRAQDAASRTFQGCNQRTDHLASAALLIRGAGR